MESTIQKYISYDEDGSMKLSIPTTVFGGYDREETCKMVQSLSDYYKNRIMRLMDDLAEKERENEQLRRRH
ncbi:MAG: hypothetical protein PUE91_07270 [Clostridiales bacterium]|nr:hypothetical protein [Clostridiales bacterium]